MNPTVFCGGESAALRYAVTLLKKKGLRFADEPGAEVTHLLLPVPTMDDGKLGALLHRLPPDVTVIGGNLDLAAAQGRKVIDLLLDPTYLSANAAITADCAIRITGRHLKTVFRNCPILILGWGRIGKCLACQLAAMGARVTVAARKETDRATAASLGFEVAAPGKVSENTRVIFNTAPVAILTEDVIPAGCIAIDLASKKGLPGENVVWARGLPGKDAPEASGRLIADCVMRLIAEKEDTP